MAAKENRRAKDAAMAAMMKKQGIKRGVMLCPICHAQISLAQAYSHIAFHSK